MANRSGSAFEQALLDLGATTSLDVRKLSAATLQSLASHVRLLQKNNIPLIYETFAEHAETIIDSLRDRHDKPITRSYARQIAITIMRLFPEVRIDTKQYPRKSNISTRLASDEYINVIRRIIRKASEIVGEVYKQDRLTDSGTYDASLAILLTTSTSLRIVEIRQLRLDHIDLIEKDQAIPIKSKGSQHLRRVVQNDLLMRTFAAIKANRGKVERAVNNLTNAKARDAQELRLRRGFLLVSSISFMRQHLRELAALIGSKNYAIGFNSFRRYIVTILAEGGGHLIAQSMNNHSNVNTTLDHYNVVTSATSERTYEKLERLMNDLLPHTENKNAPLSIPSSSIVPTTSTTATSTAAVATVASSSPSRSFDTLASSQKPTTIVTTTTAATLTTTPVTTASTTVATSTPTITAITEPTSRTISKTGTIKKRPANEETWQDDYDTKNIKTKRKRRTKSIKQKSTRTNSTEYELVPKEFDDGKRIIDEIDDPNDAVALDHDKPSSYLHRQSLADEIIAASYVSPLDDDILMLPMESSDESRNNEITRKQVSIETYNPEAESIVSPLPIFERSATDLSRSFDTPEWSMDDKDMPEQTTEYL